jgi:hypothetical protein
VLLVFVTALWAAAALLVEPLASLVGMARYRLVESGEYDHAERLERTVLRVASFARAMGVPGGLRLQASALADRAETDRTEEEFPEAESFYVRSIEAYHQGGMDDDPRLAPVLTSYAVLLSHLGRTQEAERAEERARSIVERSTTRLPRK